jgi:hypothetical protein
MTNMTWDISNRSFLDLEFSNLYTYIFVGLGVQDNVELYNRRIIIFLHHLYFTHFFNTVYYVRSLYKAIIFILFLIKILPLSLNLYNSNVYHIIY